MKGISMGGSRKTARHPGIRAPVPAWAGAALALCLLAWLCLANPLAASAAPRQERSGNGTADDGAGINDTSGNNSKVPVGPPGGGARKAPPAALGSLELQGFLTSLEADRLLLSEIRKEVPEERKEAEVYFKRLKDLASLSDPVRLVPSVNRVLEQAPIYYNWLEKKFANPSERISEYYVGGAQGFQLAFDAFQKAVLMDVINRLDIAERALREVTSEPSE